jgi:PAS domain S-box-containing protein
MTPEVQHKASSEIQGLKLILNNVSHAILFETAGNQIIFTNQQFCDLFGIPVPPDVLTGMDCSKSAEQAAGLFQDPQKFIDGIVEAYAAGKPIINEELVMADGQLIYRDYKPLIDDPENKGHLWIYKHSLELKTILSEVRDQKLFYERLLNNIPADIAIFDNEHKYVFLNKVAISKKDARHWLIGKDDFDFCKQYNKPRYLALSRRAMFVEALQTGETVEFEETNLTPAGSKVYNLRRFYPLKEADNSIKTVIGYGMNITSLREREEKLLEQEQALRDLVNSMDQLVVAINEDGIIVYANPKWELLTGLRQEAYIGKKLSGFFKKGREDFIASGQTFFLGEKNTTSNKHVTITDAKGKTRILSYYLSKYNNLNAAESRAAVFLNDITEQLIAEKNLKKVAKEERHLSEFKSSFMSLVSHELRTPLSVILSSAELIELIQDMPTGKTQTEMYLKRIINQVDKMTQLMNEFLFLSKAETGKIPYNPIPINPYVLAETLVQEAYSPWQDGRSLSLSKKGETRLVMADPLMINHILTNLISNAFKYSLGMEAPKIRILFSAKYWELYILDYGIGICEGEKHKIFQPFTRGGNVGSIEGTGFGLMVVQFFVKLHKGKVSIKSIEGKGTVIVIRFPH